MFRNSGRFFFSHQIWRHSGGAGKGWTTPALASILYSSQNATLTTTTTGSHGDGGAGRLTMDTGVYCAPKQLVSLVGQENRNVGRDCCGEDAFAIVENDFQIVLAVADGVGGWRKKGVDPSKFSRSLMRHLERLVLGRPEESPGILAKLRGVRVADYEPPHQPITSATLIKQAFWRLVNSFNRGLERPFGSSTVCVVSLDKQSGYLDLANVGDSGVLVLRSGRVEYRSRSQQHRFNAPFQLTLTPDGDASDCSNMASVDSFAAAPGDIVVVATDGLWDNLFEEDLLRIVKDAGSPREAARRLVFEARALSEKEKYESPFTKEARKHGLDYPGGKEDDITVVVAIVKDVQ